MPDSQLELWQKEAQAVGGDALVTALNELRDGQNRILKRLDAMDFDLARLTRAFPGGDTEGHLRYHEAMIERNSELRRLRIAVQEKTITGLVWMVLVAIGVALGHELQRFVGVKQ